MKIAIIGHKQIPSEKGGIEKGVEEHAFRLVKLGHQVYVYNRGEGFVFKKEYLYRDIHIITIPTLFKNSFGVVCYSFIATLVAATKHHDVVHYRASGPSVMIHFAKLFHMKCVASLHGIDSERDKWNKLASAYLKYGEKTAAEKADCLIVLSNNIKKIIDEHYHVDSIYVPNGIVKPEKDYKLDYVNYNLKKREYILYMSRIVPEKNVHLLLEAFSKIKTDKKLVICGGESGNRYYYKKIQDLADRDNRIIMTDFVKGKAKSQLLSNAYFYVLPSNLEGMSNSLLEAMSYDNCCLVSDIEENKEIAGDNAVYFKSDSANDLKERMEFLLMNNKIVKKYQQCAARQVIEKFNWDNIVKQVEEIYKRVSEVK